MNTRNLLVSVLMLVSVLLSACAPAATPPAPISVPSTVVPIVASDQSLTTFSSKIYKLHMSVSFGSDWHVIDDFTDLVTVAGTQKDWNVGFNIVTNAKLANPVSGAQIPFPEDFASWIKSNPDFKTDEPIEITVGGIQGLQIDATPMPPKQKDFLYMSGTKWNIIPSAEQWRFILLNDVNGERLLIFLIAPADQFKDAVQQSQSILDSVVFSKPTTFSTKTFNLPIILSYGPEWRVAEEYSDVFTLSYTGHDVGVSFINVKNAKIADGIAFPDDFVTWIQSPDSLFQVVDSKPVLVGGFKGIQINAIAACGDKKYWIMLSGTGWWCPGVEHIGFIYLDNVNGERVLIQIQGSPDGKDYEFIVEEAQKVLDTVVFSKPTTFSPKTFDLPITFQYGPEWKIDSEDSSEVVLKYKDYDGEFLFINPKSTKVAGPAAPYSVIPFPDDFANWIQAHGLFQVVKTQSVLVGGLPGTQIDATSACGTKITWFSVGQGGWNCEPGGHYRFIYLDDVHGERLLIMTVGYVSAQDFTLMVDAAQKVLDTVVFSKP